MKNKKNISKCLLKFLPSMQGVKKLLWLLPVHRTGENLVGPVLKKKEKKKKVFILPVQNLIWIQYSNAVLLTLLNDYFKHGNLFFLYSYILYAIIQCQLSKQVTQKSLGHKNSQK